MSEAPRVWVGGATIPNLPYGHQKVSDVNESDAIFLWLRSAKKDPDTLVYEDGFLLGQVHAAKKPLFVGYRDESVLGLLSKLKGFPTHKMRAFHSPREAYADLMADLDSVLKNHPSLTMASFTGQCGGCFSSYPAGSTVVRWEGKIFHPDCYARRKNPGAADAALFHAGLTEALRVDNAKLESKFKELEKQVSWLQSNAK